MLCPGRPPDGPALAGSAGGKRQWMLELDRSRRAPLVACANPRGRGGTTIEQCLSGGTPWMDKPSPRPRRPNEPDVADADWLFRGQPGARRRRARRGPDPFGSHRDIRARRCARAFRDRASGARVAALPPRRRPPPPRSRMVAPSAPAVDQVWSRTAEWGSTLLVLLGWGAAILVLLYFTMGAELYGVSGADPGGRRPGGRPAQLPDGDHPGAAGEDHAGAGREGLLRRAVASSPPLPADVAAA